MVFFSNSVLPVEDDAFCDSYNVQDCNWSLGGSSCATSLGLMLLVRIQHRWWFLCGSCFSRAGNNFLASPGSARGYWSWVRCLHLNYIWQCSCDTLCCLNSNLHWRCSNSCEGIGTSKSPLGYCVLSASNLFTAALVVCTCFGAVSVTAFSAKGLWFPSPTS